MIEDCSVGVDYEVPVAAVFTAMAKFLAESKDCDLYFLRMAGLSRDLNMVNRIE